MEKYFNQLNITYEKEDKNKDKELEYKIHFKPSGKLQFMSGLSGIMCFDLSDNSVTCLGVSVYRFNEGEDITPYYKIVNDANAQSVFGKFVIFEEIPLIVYQSCVFCGSECEILTIKIIQEMLVWYENALDSLYRKIFNYKKEEQMT